MPQFIICIDGLIGAGKTTVMERLSEDYICFPEPLSEWNLLPFLYKNPEVFGLPFQIQVLISQFKQKQMFPDNLVIVERCPWTSCYIFSPLILKKEDELQLYNHLYMKFAYQVDCFIYLDIDPVIAFQRIQNRSPTDSRITLEYLKDLHKQYCSKLLTQSNLVQIIDASTSVKDIYHAVFKILKNLTKNNFPSH